MALRMGSTNSFERVLVCDADSMARHAIMAHLESKGFATAGAVSVEDASQALDAAPEEHEFEVLLLDTAAATAEDIERLFAKLEPQRRAIALILMTGYGAVEAAVSALRRGAADYLVKPIVDAELDQSLDRALAQRRLLRDNTRLRRSLAKKDAMEKIIGSDPRMLRVYEQIGAVAASRSTVLMTGESGTGKSLIAHEIHKQSVRRDKPFVEISCGSIPETLLESELFGHVKGAFTGAHADKVGRFLAANEGTLFLDEINSASPAMQLKLLRVLQERRFEPVGSSQTMEVDVRVLLATNQPLEALVAAGQFRQDLYYRINVVNITLPPLRDRPGDIPLMARMFLDKHALELGRQLVGFTPEALTALVDYSYPGNVRELSNIIERAAVLASTPTIGVDDLPTHLTQPMARPAPSTPPPDTRWVPLPLEEAMLEPERLIIVRTLDANGWNRQKTAAQLAINRATLYKKMKAHGLLDDRRAAG
ncbi:MAG: sigma-54-dependent transcriptional regulator [Phycisphaerales bacterium]